jgi:hypothetical protein
VPQIIPQRTEEENPQKKSAAPEETALNFDHPNYSNCSLEKAPWAFVIEVEPLEKNLVDED